MSNHAYQGPLPDDTLAPGATKAFNQSLMGEQGNEEA